MSLALFFGLVPIGAQGQESVNKEGTALGTGSTTEVVGGDTIRWVVEYDNTSGAPLTDVRIDDAVGPLQTYVPGSFEVPDTWQALFSSDGVSYSPSEPGTVTHLRATADLVSSPVTGSITPVDPPLGDLVQAGTGGDGTNPILYQDKIFMIFHHQRADGAQISCVDRQTGAGCPGYPYTFVSGTGPGIAPGTGAGDAGTTNWPEQVDNGDLIVNGSQLLYGAQLAGEWGVGCWDMDTAENCGYWKLGDVGAADVDDPAMFEGPHRIGDRFYFVDYANDIYCFDSLTETACPNYPNQDIGFAQGMPAYQLNEHGQKGVIMGMQTVGDRLYFSQNYAARSTDPTGQRTLGARISCFDTSTETLCSGWTSRELPTSDNGPASGAFGLYLARDTTGTPTDICAIGNQSWRDPSGSVIHYCYDLDTSVQQIGPINLGAALLPGSLAFLDLNVGTKTYFGIGSFFGRTQSSPENWDGYTLCYDWAIDDLCVGFDQLDGNNNGLVRWDVVLGNETEDYGYASDGQCIFGLGNQGVLWSFDPVTGASPCVATAAEAPVTTEGFHCDGQPHTFTWNEVEITQADLTPGVEFTSILVEVFDASGTTSLLGPVELIGGIHPLDISSVAVGPGTESLVIDVEFTSVGTVAWDDGEPPLVMTTFNSDAAAQFCFETQVEDVCDLEGTVDNTVTTGTGASATASLTYVENVESCVQCPDCELDGSGAPVVVVVDEDVLVDFNPFDQSGAAPTCDDGVTSDLCQFFTADTTGPAPETWSAVFDLGGKRLLIADNATVQMVNVPPGTNSQDAPGFEFRTTCEIEIQGDLDGDGEPGTIAIDALNGNTGDIVLQADGAVIVDGHIRNTNGGTRNAVGDIRIASCCGGISTGPESRIETENHIDAGDIDLIACCGSDIAVRGLIRALVAIPPAPQINILAFEGNVLIDGTSDYGLETVAGTKVRRTSGVLARTLNRADSGEIFIQAAGDVEVIGRELLGSQKQNGAVAIRSREGGEGFPDAAIQVTALQGDIVATDRAFDVQHRFAGDNTITLHALGDVDLRTSSAVDFGASTAQKPVLDAQGGKGSSAKGGTNTVRAFQGNILIGQDVQLFADAVGGTGNTGGTNRLDAGQSGTLISIAAGAEILADAGGTDGNNEILSCVAPAIDGAALVDPLESVTLGCLSGQTPTPLTDPATGLPLTCEDFGIVYPE